jgi:hypothetical protein
MRTFEITTVTRNFTQNYIHFNNPKTNDHHELRKPRTAFTSTLNPKPDNCHELREINKTIPQGSGILNNFFEALPNRVTKAIKYPRLYVLLEINTRTALVFTTLQWQCSKESF